MNARQQYAEAYRTKRKVQDWAECEARLRAQGNPYFQAALDSYLNRQLGHGWQSWERFVTFSRCKGARA